MPPLELPAQQPISRERQVTENMILPALSVLETILTSRASKGHATTNTAQQLLKGVTDRNEKDRLAKERAIDRALRQELQQAQIGNLNFAQEEKRAAAQEKRDALVRANEGQFDAQQNLNVLQDLIKGLPEENKEARQQELLQNFITGGQAENVGEFAQKGLMKQAFGTGKSDIEALGDILKTVEGQTRTRETTKNMVEQENLRRSVRGFKHVDDSLFIKPESVKKLQGAISSTRKVNPKIDDIIDLFEQEGQALFGDKKELLKAAMTDLQLDLKSEDMANLGVLTGPDLDILIAMTGDPTSFFEVAARNFGGFNPTLVKLRRLSKNINRNLAVQADQLGFVPNFATEEDLDRSAWPVGTKVMVGGVLGTKQ